MPKRGSGDPYEWLVQAGEALPASGEKPSCSPIYRNHECTEIGPDLEATYNGCITTHGVFTRRVGLSPDSSCLGWRPILPDGTAGPYEFHTYRQVGEAVSGLARAMTLEGFGEGDPIGVYGVNSPEWVTTMIACSAIGAVVVPLYDTLGAGAVQHVIRHSAMVAIFAAAPKLPDVMQALEGLATGGGSSASENGAGGSCGAVPEEGGPAEAEGGGDGTQRRVRAVVVWGALEGDVLPKATQQVGECLGVHLWRYTDLCGSATREVAPGTAVRPAQPATDPESICTIYYTSGTTGMPKGVLISHRALVSVVSSQLRFLLGGERYGIKARFEPEDAHLSYLPLAHIYERAAVEASLALGARIGFWQGDVAKLQDDAFHLRPAIMIGVPRVWERVMQGALDKIAKRPFGIAKALYSVLSAHKLRRMAAGQSQDQASWLADRLLMSKIRDALGGHLKIIISGAAPLPRQTELFVRSALCCLAQQGYGLTETCSATTVAIPDRMDMVGTVGPISTCAEFCLESVPEMGYDALGTPARGELLVRGPCLFSGYHRMAQATAEAMDERGFFHTGDVMELCPSGALKIIDRRKNIFKLAQGEYVRVEHVETVLRSCNLVATVWVSGEATERHPVAVVIPREQLLMAWAASAGVSGDFAAVCATAEARTHVLAGLTAAAREHDLRHFERVAAVLLEPEDFTVEGGLVTPTFKLKRHELRKHYAAALAALYHELHTAPLPLPPAAATKRPSFAKSLSFKSAVSKSSRSGGSPRAAKGASGWTDMKAAARAAHQ